MGLSGPKKRTKLSHDPNNNAWLKSSNFGHKIMAAQGWQPGDYLGATNAAHSSHYTAANASHIRVLLREDNLGLGAKIGGNSADTFGLATLSSIFGRLNGDSTEVTEKKEKAMRDAELRTWQANKFGYMNFVRGGFLVGDEIVGTNEAEDQRESVGQTPNQGNQKQNENSREVTSEARSVEASLVPSKKRKLRPERREVENTTVESAPHQARSADEKIAASEPGHGDESKVETSSSVTSKSSKKSKRRDESQKNGADDESRLERKRLKEEKKARKEERQKRKAGRRSTRKAKENSSREDDDSKDFESLPASNPTVNATIQSPPLFAGSRHAVRQRYIQQKRLASMDPQALREILMLKAGA